MAKSMTTTTAPTGLIAPFGLRMLPELRAKVEAAARKSGRSMNAEITTRLQESFEEPFQIPFFLKKEPDQPAVTVDAGALVLHLTITPGMKLEEVLELLEAANMALPPGTRVVVTPPG